MPKDCNAFCEHAGESKHLCAGTVPIFKNLSSDELEMIDSLLKKKEYRKGDIIFMPGDRMEHLYIVRSGRIKLYNVSREGRQQIVRILEHGEFFGELGLFKDTYHNMNAEALEDSGLCMLPKEDLRELLRKNPEISLAIMQALSERLVYTERFIGDLTLKSVEERIASWLMVMAERSGVYSPSGIYLSIDLSRQEIANLLGTTIETVSRKLSRLESEGIVALRGHKSLVILDRKKLEEMVDE
jgi:CRP/FNR family transcriptional regulator